MARTLEVSRRSALRERVLSELDRMPERIGRYEIRGELGRGGMGIVYDAWDPQLSRPVAVKRIHPERLERDTSLAERFEREMRATSETFHDNLVAILDAGTEEGPEGREAYYVMERVVGPSLEERLQSSGPLPRREALELAAGIARGLAAAHARGLVHRDLKLANVLLPLAGGVKVADFGLCRLKDEPLAEGDLLLGSAHSIAPEQIRGDEVSSAADIFALGTLLVRMLTGQEPFAADNLETHLYRVLHDAPDGLEALDPDVRTLAHILLSKDPEVRPAEAQAVADRLAALAEADAPDLTGGPTDGRPWRSGRAGAVAAALIALVAWAVAGLYNELVALEHDLDVRWSQVENQLARQHELLPRLASIAARHRGEETERLRVLLTGIDPPATARGPERAAQHHGETLLAFALAAGISPLRHDDHWRSLSHEIAGTKNRIAVERARYNTAVGAYNQRLSQLPWRILATGRTPRAYFEPPDTALAEPELDL